MLSKKARRLNISVEEARAMASIDKETGNMLFADGEQYGHELTEEDRIPGIYDPYGYGCWDAAMTVDERHVDERLPAFQFEGNALFRECDVYGGKLFQFLPSSDHGLSKLDLAISSTRHGKCWRVDEKGNKTLLPTKEELVSALTLADEDLLKALFTKYHVATMDELLKVYPTQDRGVMVLDVVGSRELDGLLDGVSCEEIQAVVHSFRILESDVISHAEQVQAAVVLDRAKAHWPDIFSMQEEICLAFEVLQARAELTEELTEIIIEEPEELFCWGLPTAFEEAVQSRKAFTDFMNVDPWTRGRTASEAYAEHRTIPSDLNCRLNDLITYDEVLGIIEKANEAFEKAHEAWASRDDVSSRWMNFMFSIENVGAHIEEAGHGEGVRPRPGLLDEPQGELMNPEEEYLERSLEARRTPGTVNQWMGDLDPFSEHLPYVKNASRMYGHPAQYWIDRVMRMVRNGLSLLEAHPDETHTEILRVIVPRNYTPCDINGNPCTVLSREAQMGHDVLMIQTTFEGDGETFFNAKKFLKRMRNTRFPHLDGDGFHNYISWGTMEEVYPKCFYGLVNLVSMWLDGEEKANIEVETVVIDIANELYEFQRNAMRLMVEANRHHFMAFYDFHERFMDNLDVAKGRWELPDGGVSSAYGAAWQYALQGTVALEDEMRMPHVRETNLWLALGFTLNPNAPLKDHDYLRRMVEEQFLRPTVLSGRKYLNGEPLCSWAETGAYSAGIVGDMLAEIYRLSKPVIMPELGEISPGSLGWKVLEKFLPEKAKSALWSVWANFGKEKHIREKGLVLSYFAKRVALTAKMPILEKILMSRFPTMALRILQNAEVARKKSILIDGIDEGSLMIQRLSEIL